MESRWLKHLPPDLMDRVGPPEEVVHRISGALGRLSINFGIADQIVDYWVLLLPDFPVAAAFEPPRTNFQDEIEYCRRALQEEPALVNLRANGLKAFSTLKGVLNIRDWVSHGALSHYFTQPEEAFLYTKMRKTNGPPQRPGEQLEKVISFRQIERAARDINEVCGVLGEMAKDIVHHLGPSKPDRDHFAASQE